MTDIAGLVSNNLDLWTAAVERKSGAGRGGGKKLGLYGIEQLRALIFDLAARGQLVESDGSKSTKLGPNVELVMGQAPPGSACNKDGVGTIFVKTGEFGELYPEVCEWTTKPLKLARLGDVLICVVGATIGKLNLAIDCAIGRSVAAIRPKQNLDTRYLYYVLMPFTLRLRRDARGSAQGVIGKAELNGVEIRIPRLAEQQRIVSKVDELMALCDELETQSASALESHQALVESLLATLANSADANDLAANWARLESHFDTLFTTEASIDALKQTVLELAVRGKLLASRPTMETAAELLKRTKAEKAELVKSGKASRDKPLPPVDPLGGPFPLPVGWAWARFPEIGIFERGKSKHRPRNDPRLFDPPIYPLVQTGEVARADGVIQEFHSQYSELGLEQSRLWPKDTLCITIAANIADAAVLGFDACFPDSVVGFIPCPPITDPKYFLYFMRTAKADLLKFAPSTAQKNINLGILETVLIPLPPLAEMTRIVAKVDELMALCDALKAQLADAGKIQKLLADAIVERAAA